MMEKVAERKSIEGNVSIQQQTHSEKIRRITSYSQYKKGKMYLSLWYVNQIDM